MRSLIAPQAGVTASAVRLTLSRRNAPFARVCKAKALECICWTAFDDGSFHHAGLATEAARRRFRGVQFLRVGVYRCVCVSDFGRARVCWRLIGLTARVHTFEFWIVTKESIIGDETELTFVDILKHESPPSVAGARVGGASLPRRRRQSRRRDLDARDRFSQPLAC